MHQLLLTEVESSCVPAQGFIELTVTRGTNSQGGPQSSPEILRQLTVMTEEDSQGSAPPQVQALMIDGGVTYEAKLLVQRM